MERLESNLCGENTPPINKFLVGWNCIPAINRILFSIVRIPPKCNMGLELGVIWSGIMLVSIEAGGVFWENNSVVTKENNKKFVVITPNIIDSMYLNWLELILYKALYCWFMVWCS